MHTKDTANRTTTRRHPRLDRSGADHYAPPMRAIVQDRYGSADVLELRHVQRPAIAADEVLIEVDAAGVDPARGTS